MIGDWPGLRACFGSRSRVPFLQGTDLLAGPALRHCQIDGQFFGIGCCVEVDVVDIVFFVEDDVIDLLINSEAVDVDVVVVDVVVVVVVVDGPVAMLWILPPASVGMWPQT